MAENQRKFTCSAEHVFAVLNAGWPYPCWVVGALRMRDVDQQWLEPGAKLSHSVGTWPLLLDDITKVLALDATRRLPFRGVRQIPSK